MDPSRTLPELPPHLTEKTKLHGFRTLLVRKLGEVNAELERLLSNEKATLATLKIPGLGGDKEDPIDKLRRYQALLKEQIAHINKDDGLYGRCRHCGVPLSEPELTELPWADTCRGCAAKG